MAQACGLEPHARLEHDATSGVAIHVKEPMPMPLLKRPSRLRVSAAGGLVLALSLASAPTTLAQGDPTEVVQQYVTALEAKDFSSLGQLFCPEFADQADMFDVEEFAASMGADPAALLDAIVMDAEVASLDVVSQSDD